MTEVLSSADLQTIQSLGESQLSELYLSSDGDELRLTFARDMDSAVVLNLKGLYQLSLSRHPRETGNWLIGEAWIHITDGGGKEALAEAPYGFVDARGQPASRTDRPLSRLHLEGDIVLDVVCDRSP